MEIKTHYPLRSLTTFNINVDGKYFTEVASVEEIREAEVYAREQELPLLILGGGSNLLFTDHYHGLVMKVNMLGIEVVDETAGHVVVKAGAGENWDDFVAYCVERGYGGLENLSLIPGSVGASPVQNIGAYGVEMKDHFHALEFYHFESGKILQFTATDCQFGYRNSIFKQALKGKGIVLSVSFHLDREPVYKTGYGAIRAELDRMGVNELTLQSLRTAVITIRHSKLPDPALIGNAGSFFKNPAVGPDEYKRLIHDFPALVSFPQPDGAYKLAAGWLIDQCGWKGYRRGDAGVHEHQALVLVNYGNASGMDVFRLSEEISASVRKKFNVELEREVNVI